jgi:hypothetical protein
VAAAEAIGDVLCEASRYEDGTTPLAVAATDGPAEPAKMVKQRTARYIYIYIYEEQFRRAIVDAKVDTKVRNSGTSQSLTRSRT